MIMKSIAGLWRAILALYRDVTGGMFKRATFVTYSGLEYVEDFPEWDENLMMPSVSHYVRCITDFNIALAVNDNSRLKRALTCWK